MLKFPKEIADALNAWWAASFKGNVPIHHPLDLNRLAELVKLTYDKQDVFNSDVLGEFLHEQLDNGRLKKDQGDEIDKAIAMYDFGVNYLSKFF